MSMEGGTDALGAYNFKVEVDGVIIAQFKEAAGLSVELKVIEHEEQLASGQTVVKKLPGPMKWGDITLKRGKTEDKGWWEWIKMVSEGDVKGGRRNGSIALMDYDGTEKARWNFSNGWPSKVAANGLKAGGSEVILEECTIVHEGLVVG